MRDRERNIQEEEGWIERILGCAFENFLGPVFIANKYLDHKSHTYKHGYS